jgi:glycine cleavage system H protein
MIMTTTELKFTESHEWIKVTGDVAAVGVTDYAQNELGDIVYVELPELGTQLDAGQDAAVLESTKAAADIYAPVSGEVVAINEGLIDSPDLLNQASEGGEWIFKVKLRDPSEVERLLDQDAYEKMTQ